MDGTPEDKTPVRERAEHRQQRWIAKERARGLSRVIVMIPEHRKAELQAIARRWTEEHRDQIAGNGPERPTEPLGVNSGPEGRA